MSWLKDRFQELTAQVKMGDNRTASTVRAARKTQPAQTKKYTGNPDNQPGFQITNNSLTRGLSRGYDQANTLDNNRTWKQRSPDTQVKSALQQAMANPVGGFNAARGAGLARSAIGTGQALSGLYDLATPGTGTNRLSKQLDQYGKNTDKFVKDNNLNTGVYKVQQGLGDVAQAFAGGAGLAKAGAQVATKVPVVAKGANILGNANRMVNSGVTQATTKLAGGNFGQRVTAGAVRNMANPKYQAANVGWNSVQMGKDASQGKDISPQRVALDTAIGGVGLPVAGAIAGQTGRSVANKVLPTLDRKMGGVNKAIPGTSLTFTNKNGVLVPQTTTKLAGQSIIRKVSDVKNQVLDTNRMLKENQGGYVKLGNDVQPNGVLYHGTSQKFDKFGLNPETKQARQEIADLNTERGNLVSSGRIIDNALTIPPQAQQRIAQIDKQIEEIYKRPNLQPSSVKEKGVYLTSDKKYAQTFAGKNGKVLEVNAEVNKPYVIKNQDEMNLIEDAAYYPEIIKNLESQGFDGVKGLDGQVLVFDPNKTSIGKPKFGITPLKNNQAGFVKVGKGETPKVPTLNEAQDKISGKGGFANLDNAPLEQRNAYAAEELGGTLKLNKEYIYKNATEKGIDLQPYLDELDSGKSPLEMSNKVMGAVSDKQPLGETIELKPVSQVANQRQTVPAPRQSQKQPAPQAKPKQTASAVQGGKKSQVKPQSQLERTELQELANPNKGLVPSANNTPKQRGFTSSVKSSQEVSPSVQKKVSGSYEQRSTSELAINADKYSRKNLPKVTKEVNSSLDKKIGTLDDTEIANAMAVAKQHDAKGSFDQAQQIYDKLAEHGTKQGQAIQAFSLLSNRTPEGMKYQALRSLKKAGVVLDEADQKKLQTLIENVKKTQPGEVRDRGVFEIFDFVTKKTPTSKGDKLVNLWRAGLLTAPKTTFGNLLGNSSEAATRNLWTNPVAAVTDGFFSMFTGKRTKTLTGGQSSGAKEGFKKGADYMRTGFDPRRSPNLKYDAPARVNYDNKILDTYVNGVYRWMGSGDQPFYYAARNQAIKDLATADAKNLKLTGKAKDDYLTMARKDPNWQPQTFKTKSNQTEAAKYSVYQNETAIGQMASGLKKSAKQKSTTAGAIADFVLPFTQVPSAVAMRIIDRTPVGIAREIVSQVHTKSFDQRAMSEAIGNGTFGIGVFSAGVALSKAGDITGAYPQDPKERKLWESEGKQPYSVRVGNRWYSLNYMQPFGTLLAMGDGFNKDIKDGKSTGEAWNSVGANAAKSVENQSFLKGINGVLSAVNDPERFATSYTTNTAASVVPNFIRSAASASDSKQRTVKGVTDGLKGAIPGVRQSLPAKQDMFGNDLASKDNFPNMYINPLSPSRIKNAKDPLVNELRGLQDTDNGIVPTEVKKNSIKGVELKPEQIRDANKVINNTVQSEWNNVIQDERYKAMTDEDKSTLLKKVKDNIGKAYRNGMSTQLGGTGKPTDAQMRLLNGEMPDWFATKTASTTKKTSKKTTKRKSTSKRKSGGRKVASKYDYTKNLFDTGTSSSDVSKSLRSILEKAMKA